MTLIQIDNFDYLYFDIYCLVISCHEQYFVQLAEPNRSWNSPL